jgi:hypothetical protein
MIPFGLRVRRKQIPTRFKVDNHIQVEMQQRKPSILDGSMYIYPRK